MSSLSLFREQILKICEAVENFKIKKKGCDLFLLYQEKGGHRSTAVFTGLHPANTRVVIPPNRDDIEESSEPSTTTQAKQE